MRAPPQNSAVSNGQGSAQNCAWSRLGRSGLRAPLLLFGTIFARSALACARPLGNSSCAARSWLVRALQHFMIPLVASSLACARPPEFERPRLGRLDAVPSHALLGCRPADTINHPLKLLLLPAKHGRCHGLLQSRYSLSGVRAHAVQAVSGEDRIQRKGIIQTHH